MILLHIGIGQSGGDIVKVDEWEKGVRLIDQKGSYGMLGREERVKGKLK